MNNLRYIAFFSVFIFSSMSYCGNPFKTSEEITEHIKKFGYAAGEGNFNNIAFDIGDNDVELLIDEVEVRGEQEKILGSEGMNISAHGKELACDLCVYLFNKKVEYHDLRYSDEMRNLLDRITKKICLYIDGEFIKIYMILYCSSSSSQKQLGWHGDWWSKGINPSYLGFAVLKTIHAVENDDKKIKELSKLKLGHINKAVKDKFNADISGKKIIEDINYDDEESSDQMVPVRELLGFPMVKIIKTINNFSGSGYFINQEFKQDDDKLIVHCREERNYPASRMTMVVRCYCYDSEDEMKKDSRDKFPEQKECKASDNSSTNDTAPKTKPATIIEKKDFLKDEAL